MDGVFNMSNILNLPKRENDLESLTFEQLILKSETLLMNLQSDDDPTAYFETTKQMMDEFSRRLEKESLSLFDQINNLKNNLTSQIK